MSDSNPQQGSTIEDKLRLILKTSMLETFGEFDMEYEPRTAINEAISKIQAIITTETTNTLEWAVLHTRQEMNDRLAALRKEQQVEKA